MTVPKQIIVTSPGQPPSSPKTLRECPYSTLAVPPPSTHPPPPSPMDLTTPPPTRRRSSTSTNHTHGSNASFALHGAPAAGCRATNRRKSSKESSHSGILGNLRRQNSSASRCKCRKCSIFSLDDCEPKEVSSVIKYLRFRKVCTMQKCSAKS